MGRRDRPLTARQAQILRRYAATGSYKITAAELGISLGTVSTTLANIRARYGVETTIQAYRFLANHRQSN